jgi:DnaJ-class molecular chaperone
MTQLSRLGASKGDRNVVEYTKTSQTCGRSENPARREPARMPDCHGTGKQVDKSGKQTGEPCERRDGTGIITEVIG